MIKMAAKEIKSHLGEIFDDLEKNENASVLIERNKKQVAMMLPSETAKKLILSGYAYGTLSRQAAMKQLGFKWYGDLLDAMTQENIKRPEIEERKEQEGINWMLELLSNDRRHGLKVKK